jgi:hypothetical protein
MIEYAYVLQASSTQQYCLLGPGDRPPAGRGSSVAITRVDHVPGAHGTRCVSVSRDWDAAVDPCY